MRIMALGFGILLLGNMAAAQANATSSWFATNRYDWSATAPLVNAPILQLATSPAQIGATTATAGNAVGASASAPVSLGVSGSAVMMPTLWSAPAFTLTESQPNAGSAAANADSRGLELGAAEFDSAYDFPDLGQHNLAQMAVNIKKGAGARHPAKVYTNEDVQRLKDQEKSSQPNSPAQPSIPPPSPLR
jgi:hypothetical protein